MLCFEFKKTGGGKGRPGRNTKCIACGLKWSDHGNSIKHEIGVKRIIKKQKISNLNENLLPELSSKDSETKSEAVFLPELVKTSIEDNIREKPTSSKTVSKTDKLNALFAVANKIFVNF